MNMDVLEGCPKLAYKAEKRLENTGTFTVLSEDHTLGNLLQAQLHLDEHVAFAGYRVPHPQEAKMLVKVQVKSPLCRRELTLTK